MSVANWQDNIIDNYHEERVKQLLEASHTIAVVGMRDITYKPSYYVPKYMLDQGYEIIPVNPSLENIEGLKCYADLLSLPKPVDIVQLFRRSQDVMPHAEEAVNMQPRPKAAWMQSGIINMEAAEKMAQAGILVVMDRCMYVDHMRFFGRS